MSVPQLPLTLRYPPDQRLDTFVHAPPGAVEQLRALATLSDGPVGNVPVGHVPVDNVYLAGPARAAYLPLVAAAGRLRDALEALEGNDLVALDGLEAIAGNRDDEVALFDAHNRARAAGIRLVYSARDIPDAIGLGLPDLRSRLGQCTRITLALLDDEGRREVLRQRAQRRGLVLEEPALDWLLKRVGRDLG